MVRHDRPFLSSESGRCGWGRIPAHAITVDGLISKARQCVSMVTVHGIDGIRRSASGTSGQAVASLDGAQ